MSDAVSPTQSGGVRQHLRTRWQIPLLLISCALFGWGLWSLRPAPPVIPFEQRLAQITALRRADLFPEASRLAESLLAEPERTPQERATLHRAMGDIIDEAEASAGGHDPVNLERLIQHYRLAAEGGENLDGPTLLHIAKAWEWLQRRTRRRAPIPRRSRPT